MYMKPTRTLIKSILLFISLFISCKQKPTRPETAIDTARDFISASLDGNFEEAETLLFHDTENIQMFNMFKEYREKLPDATKKKYEAAEYKIDRYDELNDSTVIVNYSNDFMHQPMHLKVIKKEEKWYIDFKFISAKDSTSKTDRP